MTKRPLTRGTAITPTSTDNSPHSDWIPDGIRTKQADGVARTESIFVDQRRAQLRGFRLDFVPVKPLLRGRVDVPR